MYVISPILFKFWGNINEAVKWWHANFEFIWTSLRALQNRFSMTTFSIEKGLFWTHISKCHGSHDFNDMESYYILNERFWYPQKIDLTYFPPKSKMNQIQGVPKKFVIFEQLSLRHYCSKYRIFNFFENFSKNDKTLKFQEKIGLTNYIWFFQQLFLKILFFWNLPF